MANEEEVRDYRALSQQYQIVAMQRQSLEAQKAEMDATLKELENAKGKVYFAAGSVLIESTKGEVKSRLEKQRKEAVEAVEKLGVQEKKVRSRLEELQKKLRGSGKDE